MQHLGYTATDRITGFRGVLTGFAAYITGCNQYLVQPVRGDDGKIDDSKWIDEQRLEVDPNVKRITLDNGSSPGFDKPAPKR